MKLPHLDQMVLLERGEAGVLVKALAVLVRDVTHASRPIHLMEVLTFAPLFALGKSLVRLHQREQLALMRPGKRPKPRQFRVSYDQLAALLHQRLALYHCGLSEEETLQMQVVLGKFHQESLNLNHWMKF